MDKYELLRKRLLDHFFFRGRVASHVYPGLLGNRIKFADQTIYLGQALMVFSSEIAVHAKHGNPDSSAKTIILELLTCMEELEVKANSRYGAGRVLEGFFVRDDITGADDPRLESRFTAVESDWQDPQKENDSPSIDQIIGIMSGLLGVVRFSNEPELTDKAQALSSRLFEYARRSDFILQLPNGTPTSRGSDGRIFASLLNGLNKAITTQDRFDVCKVKLVTNLPIRQGLTALAAFWDSPSTAKALSTLADEEFKIPLTDISLPRRGFVLHMLLMLLVAGEVWSQLEVETLAKKSNHHLSALLYAVYHNAQPASIKSSSIDEILQACPLEGPSQGLPNNTGWQHDNRWVRCTNIYEPAAGADSYNGLDWLLLYNISRLAFAA